MSYWDHRRPVRRARAVDVDAVARIAVELLDAGGLRALTVRAVAARLGVAPASLYSRVASVDDLYDLALDAALGADAEVAAAADSTQDLLVSYYRHLVRHPWACQVIAMRPPRGPHHLALSERIVTAVAQAGAREPLTAAYLLSNFVIGSATTAPVAAQEPATAVDPDLAPTYAGLHEHQPPTNAEHTATLGIAALLHAVVHDLTRP